MSILNPNNIKICIMSSFKTNQIHEEKLRLRSITDDHDLDKAQ